MNWFIVVGAIVNFAASTHSLVHHKWAWAGIWFCYGTAALLLAYAELKSAG